MSNLICRRLSFGYQGADHMLFEELDLLIDSHWRTCLTGRNGRGKTTLMQLLNGSLQPDSGTIETSLKVRYFPPPVADPNMSAFAVARAAAGPFEHWEALMQQALDRSDASSLDEYGALQQRYEQAGGYEVDAHLQAELDALTLPEQKRNQPFSTLSGGEQTRTLLAGLFVAKDQYVLIDEPTNHLDAPGRELLANYLATKPGFLLVSHDRAFVDRCTDHVLALNADTVEIVATRFSLWRAQFHQQLAAAEARNKALKAEIKGFEQTAAARRSGADAREAAKTGAMDKGFEGARAARQMKRALAAERRAEHAADQRRQSLVNTEKHYPVAFNNHFRSHGKITAANCTVVREHPLFEPVSFQIEDGACLAVTGANGCGKSSLLDVLAGEPLAVNGTLQRPARLRIGYAQQEPLWQQGLLAEHLSNAALNEAAFRQILAALGLRGSAAETPLQQLSHGQRKKIDLARTLLQPSDLLLWDEPLNYLDIDAREALEQAILVARPTLILVEHDATFVSNVATATLHLTKLGTVQ